MFRSHWMLNQLPGDSLSPLRHTSSLVTPLMSLFECVSHVWWSSIPHCFPILKDVWGTLKTSVLPNAQDFKLSTKSGQAICKMSCKVTLRWLPKWSTESDSIKQRRAPPVGPHPAPSLSHQHRDIYMSESLSCSHKWRVGLIINLTLYRHHFTLELIS